MLLNFDKLYNKYQLKIKGIIHIGAHFGQEYDVYEKYNIDNLIFYEPLPHTFEILKNKLKDTKCVLVNKALGNEIKEVEMFVESANQGQSSSMLQPILHLLQYPNIKFNERVMVDMTRLDDDLETYKDYNFINIDVQGFEMEVFKGAEKVLNNIDYVMTEVNREEVYKECAKVNELDEYLGAYGFSRVETTWDGGTWGDAFYIKNN